jgi:hypothetical protein
VNRTFGAFVCNMNTLRVSWAIMFVGVVLDSGVNYPAIGGEDAVHGDFRE